MRKVTAVLILTLASVVLSAGAAMADSNYPPTVVKGASGSKGDGGTAFTGASQLPFAMLMIAALVVVGATALIVARRRATRLEG